MKRVRGFTDSLDAHGISQNDVTIDCCGYPPDTAAQSLSRRYEELGRMPRGLFVNGVTALEGVLQFASSRPRHELDDIAVGSFDWDPFAAHLSFEVTMVRQNVETLISEAFVLLDAYRIGGPNPLVVVPTSFGKMGERESTEEDWDGDVPVVSLGGQ